MAGAIVYFAALPLQRASARRLLPLLMLLAVCPDLDYLGIWIFEVTFYPRFTHSLMFTLGAATSAWLAVWLSRRAAATPILWAALTIAAVSHPALDLMVGAHSVPLLWPHEPADVSMPFGILPSAGKLDAGNFYLWRNLAIEFGIFLPLLAIAAGVAHQLKRCILALMVLCALPIFASSLAWAASLSR